MSTINECSLITVIKVRLDAKNAFSIWQEKFNGAVSAATGFISLEMSPRQSKDHTAWTSIQRFNSNKHREEWERSQERAHLLKEVEPILIDPIEDIESDAAEGSSSVTQVFVTRVTPENYAAYREWASKIQQVEAQFPGYLGIYIQAPEKGKIGNWITILRFDTVAHLDAWLASDQRKRVVEEAEKIVQEVQSHRVVSPFAGWFSNITQATGEAPARWKQTMLVLLVLFPLVMLEIKFLNPLTSGLNRSFATFIANAISVTLVSWPMMPIAIWFLSWWLAPGMVQNRRKLVLGTAIILGLYLIEIAVFWHLF